MIENLLIVAYVASHYLHVVAAALIVGGTLFYLWVVPFAIEELKEESQLLVFARARLVFRWMVFISAVLLLISGAFVTARSIATYRNEQIPLFRQMAEIRHPNAPPTQVLDHPPIFDRPALWFSLHVGVAILCLLIAVALVRGRTPPHAPLLWMRLNFVLLLLAILLASLTRNARQRLFESIQPYSDELPASVHE
jgi:hypothetical protein